MKSGQKQQTRRVPRRMRLLTKCCQAKVYLAIGPVGFPHCGACHRWMPELQIVPAHGVSRYQTTGVDEAAE